MKKLLFLSFAVLGLQACSTVLTGQTQPFMVVTPGAENTICHIYNEDMKYKIDAGREYEIMKSRHPLTVDCRAPGNRQQIITLDSHITDAAYGNVLTAGAGAVYDHFSKGLYAYPELVSISFVDMQSTLYPLPDYMTDDLKGSEGRIESYGPSTPQIQADETIPYGTIQRRDYSRSITGSPFGASERGEGTIPASK